MAAIHGIMFATKGRPWHEAYNFVNDAGHTENERCDLLARTAIAELRKKYSREQLAVALEEFKTKRANEEAATQTAQASLFS